MRKPQAGDTCLKCGQTVWMEPVDTDTIDGPGPYTENPNCGCEGIERPVVADD